MAAIDKIYGNMKEYLLLYYWLKKNKPYYLRYVARIRRVKRCYNDKEEIPISSFSVAADLWLIKNCPLKFVLKRIKQQYRTRNPYAEYKIKQAYLKQKEAALANRRFERTIIERKCTS